MLPSTQAIEAFEAAARSLSFEAAARELNITPSAVSHRIAGLEKSSGVRLFHRTVRQVRLTTFGESLLADARKALDALAAFTTIATPASIRISATPMFGVNIILPLLEEFHERHPDIRVQLEMATVPKTVDTYEAVIRHGKISRREWTSRAILSTRLVPVRAQAVLYGADKPFPLIAYTYSRSTWRGVIPKNVDTQADAVIVPGMAEAIASAKAGHGVALVNESFIREELKSGALVRLPHWKVKHGAYYFCQPRQGGSLAARTFSVWLKDNLQDNSQ